MSRLNILFVYVLLTTPELLTSQRACKLLTTFVNSVEQEDGECLTIVTFWPCSYSVGHVQSVSVKERLLSTTNLLCNIHYVRGDCDRSSGCVCEPKRFSVEVRHKTSGLRHWEVFVDFQNGTKQQSDIYINMSCLPKKVLLNSTSATEVPRIVSTSPVPLISGVSAVILIFLLVLFGMIACCRHSRNTSSSRTVVRAVSIATGSDGYLRPIIFPSESTDC
ncbi:uncharacterized protein [Littorina saxatilis]|uniref:uncharacterized protein n=1 Tax=Littorina saxatilis TaxID=31220 RepID=UPI0038B4D95D